MTQKWQRTNSWSKQHLTVLFQSVRLVLAKEKPDVLSNTGETAHFYPLASLFETAETFWLKAFKSNSARGNAQHGKLQTETKQIDLKTEIKTRISQCELSPVKGGARCTHCY